jgi:hypothetical protein
LEPGEVVGVQELQELQELQEFRNQELEMRFRRISLEALSM